MYRIFACTGLRHRSKKIKSGVTGIHFSSIVETKVGYSVCYIKGQNAITNKRLYLLSWWADIMTSRRRGWCSYIELLSTRHFDLPGAIFRLAPLSNKTIKNRYFEEPNSGLSVRFKRAFISKAYTVTTCS